MRSRPWLLLMALLVVAGVLVSLRAQQGQDPDWHSSRSDGPKGTSALLLYSAALGRPARTVASGFDLPEPPATLFVFDPFSGYSPEEASRLKDWVGRGGTLVYADEQLDGQLGRAFGIRRIPGFATSNGIPAVPLFAGVRKLGSNVLVSPLTAGPDQVAAFRYGPYALAVVAAIGSGRVVVLADPAVLTNGFLGQDDNWLLAAELIEAAPVVAIDEFHHDLGNVSGANDWSRQPLGLGLLWTFIAIFAGVALRNRQFGPRVFPGAAGERSSAEHVQAVGRLLSRFGGRRLALDLALGATRRALLDRLGISRDATPEKLAEVLERSSPEVAAEWAAAQRDAYHAAQSGSDSLLARAASRLHALAYPMSPQARIGK
ncbi:MAG: DUF4350 domain-containing protein [Chloroflexota bacterium]